MASDPPLSRRHFSFGIQPKINIRCTMSHLCSAVSLELHCVDFVKADDASWLVDEDEGLQTERREQPSENKPRQEQPCQNMCHATAFSMEHMMYVLNTFFFYRSIYSYLVERVQVSLVGPKCALDGLGTAVAAELPSDIDRLVRKDFKDLFVTQVVQDADTDW